MKIIRLKEKHSSTCILWSDDKNIQEIIANKIISIRIREKFWYSKEDLVEINKAKADNKCLKYLYSRKDYEYEGFEIETVIELH